MGCLGNDGSGSAIACASPDRPNIVSILTNDIQSSIATFTTRMPSRLAWTGKHHIVTRVGDHGNRGILNVGFIAPAPAIPRSSPRSNAHAAAGTAVSARSGAGSATASRNPVKAPT